MDTDQVVPTRFVRRSRRDPRYHQFLFHDLRFNEDGSEKPHFILNQAPYRAARILVASKNYACGSSRSPSVFVHYEFGFRAVIATSMGDAFYDNCFKNGILPVRLAAEVTDRLRAQLHAQPGSSMQVDLESQTVTGPDGDKYLFEVDAFAKHCLLAGLDDIGLTLQHTPEMEAFERSYYETNIWLRNAD